MVLKDSAHQWPFYVLVHTVPRLLDNETPPSESTESESHSARESFGQRRPAAPHGNNGRGALLPPLHIVGVEHNLCPHAPLPTRSRA
jgi:hypothetical protein